MVEKNLYPIRLVSKMTGLPSDTIRAWERRYKAIAPDRSAGNTRLFSDENVKRLSLLREATELGHSIGAIAALQNAQLVALIQQGGRGPETAEDSVGAIVVSYLAAIDAFDIDRAHDILKRAGAVLEPGPFVFEVVIPIIQQVGKQWYEGALRVAQEHVITAQLSALIAAIPVQKGKGRRIVFASPPDERHAFGLLIGGLLAKLRGCSVIELGPDVPFDEMLWTIQKAKAHLAVLSVVRDPDPGEMRTLNSGFHKLARSVPVWIGCPEDHQLVDKVDDKNVRFVHRFEDFDRQLAEL